MPLLGLLLLLLASPLVMFALHAVVHRFLDRRRHGVSAHSSAFVAIGVGFAVLVASAWSLALIPVDLHERLGTLVYIAAVYAALAILYIDVINIAETSLHMHLLLRTAWNGSLPVDAVREQYSEARMIQSRLHRLASMGQLRVEGERCQLASRSTLRFNAVLDVWRRILGLPTDPPGAAGQAA